MLVIKYLLLVSSTPLPCVLFPRSSLYAYMKLTAPVPSCPTADPPADNGGSPVSTFIVEVWSGSECRVLKVEESEVAVHSLAPGVPYQVRIAATSDGGQGEVCAAKGLTAWPHPPPPSPFSGLRRAKLPLPQNGHQSLLLWPLWGHHGNTV